MYAVCSVADEPIDDAADDGEHESGKGGCPESADGHAWYEEAGDLEHEAVDHEGEEAEGEKIERQREYGDDRFDDGVDDGENDGTEHKGCDGIKVESLHELGSEIQPETVAQKMNDQ